MNTETRLQEIERKLANIESSSLGRAGQLELPLDPTTEELLKDFISRNGSVSQLPIGFVFISTVSDDPADLLGYGTWTEIGAGKVLVGQDTGDADFETLGDTGGAKTHTLTINQIPAHTHSSNDTKLSSGSSTAYVSGPSQSTSSSLETSSTGGGQAHNNLQPYLVVKMWERTA